MAKDKILNGGVLGAIAGVLVATSEISILQTIVSSVATIIPESITFAYADIVLFGLIGFIVGLIIDKR